MVPIVNARTILVIFLTQAIFGFASTVAIECDDKLNQTYSKCGQCKQAMCDVLVDQQDRPVCEPRSCEYDPGCRCKNGFVWHQGVCIALSDCPKFSKCDEKSNQTLSSCGKCEYINCAVRRLMPLVRCELCDADRRSEDCRCKNGYVWHEGVCIAYEDCPDPCKENQHITFSGASDWHCDPSCSNPAGNKTSNGKCPTASDFPQCKCNAGYVRNDSTGECIKKEECPKS